MAPQENTASVEVVPKNDWAGLDELSANLKWMEEATPDHRFREDATISDLVSWALASPWAPFDPAQYPYQSSPLPLPENEGVDELLTFDGVVESRDEIHGRFLSASRDLEAGETLIAEKPFASILHLNHNQVVCCLCKRHPLPEEERIVCQNCGSAAWCSSKCQDASMRLFHAFECPFLQCKEKFWLSRSRLFRLSARMIIKGWKNVVDAFLVDRLKLKARNSENFLRTEFDLIANDSCVLGSLQASVLSTGFHVGTEPRYAVRAALWTKTYLYLLKSAGVLERLKSVLLPLTAQASYDLNSLELELDQFVAETLYRHVIRLKCNHFESRYSSVGTSLYLTIAQINHSCRPNCSNFFRGDTQYLRVMKSIKKGEELFILYDKAIRSIPGRGKRKKYIQSQFGFECLCNSCNEGEDLETLYSKQDQHKVNEEEEEEVLKEIERCKRLLKYNLNEKAEKAIYAVSSTAAAAEMWRSVAELEDLLTEVQCQEKI